MFVDKARIEIKAGDGGNGIVSFRREKYVPEGGPDGGNGGKGGDVIFKVDSGMRTLMDFRYKAKFSAERGEDGSQNKSSGKNGKDCIIYVPPGTIIIDEKSGRVVADLSAHKAEFVAARGGKGGFGNAEFKSSIRRAPNFARAGFKGRERTVILELKSIADVGLVGFPNVGKSTILAAQTKAKPKIANYHFTTLKPNLGVVEEIRGKSFVMADIPGLIEGASSGLGLGHDFLRHIERTRLLVHVVDVSGSEGREPIEDFEKINEEIRKYNPVLADKPMIVLANKTDIASEENIKAFSDYIAAKGLKLFEISAVSGKNLSQAMKHITTMLDEIPVENLIEDIVSYEELDAFDFDPNKVIIERDGNSFVLQGEGIERLMYSIDLSDLEGIRSFDAALRKKGIMDRLKEEGLEEGDSIVVGNYEFEYFE